MMSGSADVIGNTGAGSDGDLRGRRGAGLGRSVVINGRRIVG